MRLNRKNHILGKTSVDTFLKKYWQKKPLLIRNAIENFQSPITEKDLFNIAQDEEAISRLIEYKQGLWQVKYGPFEKSDFPKKRMRLGRYLYKILIIIFLLPILF